ncbi:MAG: nucleoside kinase [Pseudomonadota bacterium]
MGLRNYLVEGVSATGKTSVCHELIRRGYVAFNGDQDLAYQGDPTTGEPLSRAEVATDEDSFAWAHAHHIWEVGKVRRLAADQSNAMTFFCGGSRNFAQFVDLFDAVFILDVDASTLRRRLQDRPADEFGSRPNELELILRLHANREDLPRSGFVIDATAPIERVVDEILQKCA